MTPNEIAHFERIITTICEQHPELDRWGYGISYRRRYEARLGKTFNVSPFVPEQDAEAFWASVEYLRHLKPLKTYPKWAPGSYGLKHDVEHWTNDQGRYVYVSNGVLIAAGIFLGIPFRQCTDGAEINVEFRLSAKDRYGGHPKPAHFRAPAQAA